MFLDAVTVLLTPRADSIPAAPRAAKLPRIRLSSGNKNTKNQNIPQNVDPALDSLPLFGQSRGPQLATGMALP